MVENPLLSPSPALSPSEIPLIPSNSVLESILERFLVCRSGTFQVLDWYKQSWKDICEELRVLVNPGSGAEVDLKGKTGGFEGVVTGVKKAVIHAENVVVKTCLKQRGKYTETECVKKVESAFERMAGEVWKLLGGYMQKTGSGRAADTLRSLIKMQSDADHIATQVKALQAHFEDTLRHQVTLTTHPKPHTYSEPDSDKSLLSSSPRHSDIDLKEQGNRLLHSFQRFTTSGRASDGGTIGAHREMDLVLRDMMAVARSSKGEAGKTTTGEDLRLERHLARIRRRIDSLCRNFEEGATPIPTALSVSPSLPSPHPASSDLPPVHDDLQHLTQVQGSIMSDLRDMRKHMDKVISLTKDSNPTSTQSLNVLKAFMPHLQAESDSQFVTLLMNDILSTRKSQFCLINLLKNEGILVETMDEVGKEYLKLKKEYEEMKENNDEMVLNVIKMQSEGELETNYLQNRIKTLECELEMVKNGRNSPDSGSFRAKKSVEMAKNSLDEENAILSMENFALLRKLEEEMNEKMRLIDILSAKSHEIVRKTEENEGKEGESDGNMHEFTGRRMPSHQSAPPASSLESGKLATHS